MIGLAFFFGGSETAFLELLKALILAVSELMQLASQLTNLVKKFSKMIPFVFGL